MYKKICIMVLSCLFLLSTPATVFADWSQDEAGWRYQQAGAFVSSSWTKVENSLYHFNPAGYMDVGWLQDNGKSYYLDSQSGAMLTGIHIISNQYCSFAASGELIGAPTDTHIEGLDDALLKESIFQTARYWPETEYGLSLVNEERSKQGLSPLILDYSLCIIANYRSAYMEAYNHFGHYQDGIDLSNTVASAYFGHSANVGENIYCGYTTNGSPLRESVRDSVLEGFNWYLSSPGHYGNIICPDYTKIGIGIYSNTSNSKRYFTQIFQY